MSRSVPWYHDTRNFKFIYIYIYIRYRPRVLPVRFEISLLQHPVKLTVIFLSCYFRRLFEDTVFKGGKEGRGISRTDDGGSDADRCVYVLKF